MNEDISNPIKRDLNVCIDEVFQTSDNYQNFGFVNIHDAEYVCNVAILISASEDIEVVKVIDFLKDFIPAQLDESTDEKFLNKIKYVNNKIAEVLSQTLSGESFIDVALAYILIKKNLFYVSLDDGYELSLSRNGNLFNIREDKQDNVTGSGVLNEGDNLDLYFRGERVFYLAPQVSCDVDYDFDPVTDNELVSAPQDLEMNNIAEDSEADLSKNVIQDQDSENSEQETENEELPNIVDMDAEEAAEEQKVNKVEKITKEENAFLEKIKSILASCLKYVGEAFSYIITLIFRGKKGRSVAKALPNKKKGFLILAALVFLVILLGVFIKSASDENTRKQQEQTYRDSVAQVGKDIKQVEDSSSSIPLGDKTIAAKLTNLQNEIKGVDDNPLKNKVNAQNDINDYYSRINSLQDRLNGIVRVDESSVLSRFGGFIPNSNPSGFAVKDGKIYTTDLNNAKVYMSDLVTIGAPLEVISSGLTKPMGLEFSKSKLLVLDQGHGIYDLDPVGKTLKKIAGYDIASETSIAIKTYYDKDTDNFYLLQSSKKSIQRVPGLGNGNFAVATKYNKDDFDFDASDFAIVGGSAYIIDNNGNIYKYTRSNSAGATKDPIVAPLMDIPFGANSRIAGMEPRDSGSTYLFVADPANNRIVVIDNKDPNNMKFIAQFKPQDDKIFDFKNIKGLKVDESGGKIALLALSTYGIFKINVDIR